MTYVKRLTVQDLIGRLAISYLRWSSAPQEKGSTIERQQETLDHILAHYRLVLDQALTDRGLSASKGHHRTRGKLFDLLEMVRRREIKPGTVLIIEAYDRLFREGLLDVMPILADMIKGGLIIVTGDLSIWGEAEINDQGLSHKLLAELNAAALYARRLSELSAGAHAKKRSQMEALADDPSAPKPVMNSRPPGWIVRDGHGYALHKRHTETVRLIFRLCLAGNSTKQIAAYLNKLGTPLLGEWRGAEREWRASRIAALLRDEKVLGFFQPCIREGGTRVPKGRKVLLYPAAIDAATWIKARELLLGRQTKLKGPKGVGVANMFRGKVFCGTCRAAMRVDTGGHASKTGIRKRKLQCSRFIETRTCSDGTRYDLHYFEPLILDKIIELSALVPRTADTDHQAGAERLAELQVRVAMLEESIGTLAPRIGVSAALASQVEKMSIELDGLRRKADIMVLEQQAATSSNTRHVDTWEFIRVQVGPALRGNVEARERVRGLLARVAFQIKGWDTPPGSLALEIGGHTEVIEPAGLRFTVESG